MRITAQEQRDNFVYEVATDFKGPDGNPATWASNQPATWGQEDKNIDLKLDAKDLEHNNISIALSPDEALLAVVVGTTIRIYAVPSRELVETLSGHHQKVGTISFRPVIGPDGVPETSVENAKYTLLSNAHLPNGRDQVCIFWYLSSTGKDLQPPRQLPDPNLFTQKVKSFISDELSAQDWELGHEISQELDSNLNNAVSTMIDRLTVAHRPVIYGGLCHFNSSSWNHSGSYIFYSTHNDTTQSKMRLPEDLPTINVFDIATSKVKWEFRGHTDAIMWVGCSPNDKYLASAAWDGTVRVWDIHEGKEKWEFGNFGGQMWAGAWSLDSRYLAFSVGSPKTKVFVYDVVEGKEKYAPFEEVTRWARYMSFSPDNNLLAAGSQVGEVGIWDLSSPSEGPIFRKWELKREGFSLTSVMDVQFFDNGTKLAWKTTLGTLDVYDLVKNKKWCFWKEKDRKGIGHCSSDSLVWAGTMSRLVSADPDGFIRFWKLDE
ncbi:WD40-repeat-containing domain protein [Xylogone sp. PMI_703]|nr:WD40-repeat-containing domain protein [Xylogone sp. PMI_703]